MCRKSLCHKRQPKFFRHIFLCRPNNNRFRILSRIKKRDVTGILIIFGQSTSTVSNSIRHAILSKKYTERVKRNWNTQTPTYGFKTSSSKHTQEERFGMLMEYLREYTFITRQEYPVLLYPMIDFIERNPAPFSPNAFVPIPYAARYNHIDACPMGQLQ